MQKGAQRSSCLLKSARKVGSSDIVEIVLEGTGDIEPSSINPEAFEGGKMELVAGFRYEERLDQFQTTGAGSHIRVFRQYEQAGMKRHYAGQVTRPLLDSAFLEYPPCYLLCGFGHCVHATSLSLSFFNYKMKIIKVQAGNSLAIQWLGASQVAQ